jgi:PAS domain S-box-containing protein
MGERGIHRTLWGALTRYWKEAASLDMAKGDPSAQLSARLVLGILDLILVAVAAFAVVALAEREPIPMAARVTLFCGFVVVFGLRRLAVSGRFRAAALALCVVGWLGVATDLPVHGEDTVAAGGFLLLVLIGGFSLGSVAAVALALATVVLLGAVMLHLVPVVPTPVPAAQRLTHYTTQLTLAAAVVAWWAGRTRALLRQLRSAETQYGELLEGSPDAIVRVDETGVITFCNAAVERSLGYDPSELLGRPWYSLPIVAPAQLDGIRGEFVGAIGGGPLSAMEIGLVHRDGHPIAAEVKGYPVWDPDGRITGFVAIFRDISERKNAEAARLRLQEQLLLAQRLEAVGRFAGGIAHDFNNILTIILSAIEVVDRNRRPSEAAALDDARDAIARGAALTRQVLTFTKRQPSKPRATDVNGAVTALGPMLQRLLGEAVKLELDLRASAPHVLIDPAQVDQILVNLAVNAKDAMSGSGTIGVATENAPEARLVLRVVDDGAGMDAPTQARAFEPFFTTKGERGTGLGLSVVQSIVQLAGGSIACDSRPGSGTTFRIEFPVLNAVPPEPAAERSKRSRTTRRHVVFVDDDPGVRQTVARGLQAAGVEVEAVGPPFDVEAIAVQLVQADALVTDLVMPGMNGADLVDALRKRGCTAPVVFVSGHAEHALLERVQSTPKSAIVAKPFTLDDILARLEALLQDSR